MALIKSHKLLPPLVGFLFFILHTMQEMKTLWADSQTVRKYILEIAEARKQKRWIYILVKDNEIVYVGQTRDLEERLAQHVRQKKRIFDRYMCFDYPSSDYPSYVLDWLENDYIIALRPKLNSRINCPKWFADSKHIWNSFRVWKKWLDENLEAIRHYKYKNLAYYSTDDIASIL